jgi:hypothetical protein
VPYVFFVRLTDSIPLKLLSAFSDQDAAYFPNLGLVRTRASMINFTPNAFQIAVQQRTCIRLFDLVSGEAVGELETPDKVLRLIDMPAYVIAASDKEILIWQRQNGVFVSDRSFFFPPPPLFSCFYRMN